MFFHLLYIHLFRPFLKYNPSTSPLPSHVSPRKLCTQAAAAVSKLMRLYKRTYGLRQICNIAVYIVHSACTIHLLNLPEKTAKRDIIHGIKHLEEIAEDWLCARRTLSILSVLARKWKIELPEEASTVLARTDAKFGFFSTADVPSPKQELLVATPPSTNTSPPRTSQSLPAPTQPPQIRARPQNQLQQSIYSYRPDVHTMPQNITQSHAMNSLARPVSSSQMITPSPTQHHNQHQSTNTGMGSMPHTSPVSAVPYPRHPYTNNASTFISRPRPITPATDLSRNNSAVTSESSRQVSPNTLFGGVDALVESQDWWLRDQASLAMGFDNWMGVGNGPGDMSGRSSVANLSGSEHVTTNGGATPVDHDVMGGFYMARSNNGNGHGQSGRGHDGSYDEEWSYS